MNETSSLIVMGTVRYSPGWLWVQLTKVSPLTKWPPWFGKQQSRIAKIGAEFITHASLVFLERALQKGQNHLYPNDKISGLRNCLREVWVSVDTCRDIISRFSYETEKHRQVLQDTVVLSALEIKLLAANDMPLSLSKTSYGISATSCWEFKSKGVTLVLDILHFKAHKVWWINMFGGIHLKQPWWDY